MNETEFDPTKQYGEWILYSEGGYLTARNILQTQIDRFIPKEYQKRIKWTSNHGWPEDIRDYYNIPEDARVLAWKYTPKRPRTS